MKLAINKNINKNQDTFAKIIHAYSRKNEHTHINYPEHLKTHTRTHINGTNMSHEYLQEVEKEDTDISILSKFNNLISKFTQV